MRVCALCSETSATTDDEEAGGIREGVTDLSGRWLSECETRTARLGLTIVDIWRIRRGFKQASSLRQVLRRGLTRD